MKHTDQPPTNPGLGQFVEGERLARGWTYERLGREMGVSKITANRIARGKVFQPDFTTLGRLAVALARTPIAGKPELTSEQYLSALLAAGGIGAIDTSANEAELRRIIHLMRTSAEAPILMDALERMRPDLRRQVLVLAQALLAEQEASDPALHRR